MSRLALTTTMLLLLAACGGPDPGNAEDTPVNAASPEEPPAAQTAAPEIPPETTDASMTATVRVVDLAGAPLAGMTPIVTKSPNAFDAPVATGSPTDGQGGGIISFPTTERLYLRAWDPALNYFPNNFFEVLPGGGRIEGDLGIQMVPAAALSAQFLLPDDQIAAETTVGVMLFHPTRGPWWPAEGNTNRDGFVVFDHLPAGEYVLRFKVLSGARLEHPETALPPGETVDLGILSLQ